MPPIWRTSKELIEAKIILICRYFFREKFIENDCFCKTVFKKLTTGNTYRFNVPHKWCSNRWYTLFYCLCGTLVRYGDMSCFTKCVELLSGVIYHLQEILIIHMLIHGNIGLTRIEMSAFVKQYDLVRSSSSIGRCTFNSSSHMIGYKRWVKDDFIFI